MSGMWCLLVFVVLVFAVDIEGKPQPMNGANDKVLRSINMVRNLGRKLINEGKDRQKKASDVLVCNSCHGTQYSCEYEEKECAPGQVCGSIWDNDNNFSFNGCMEPQLCGLVEKTSITSVSCCETDLCNWQI